MPGGKLKFWNQHMWKAQLKSLILLLIIGMALVSLGCKSTSVEVHNSDNTLSKPNLLREWKMAVAEDVYANWNFDPKFKELDQHTKSTIHLRILKDGSAEYIKFRDKSGNELFDISALKAVEKSIPFKELPKGVNSHEIVLIFSPRGLK